MASPTSSRASSPDHSLRGTAAPPDFDYLDCLAKHSGNDALVLKRTPSPGFTTEQTKPRADRTLSGLEEGRPTPKRRPSVASVLLTLGGDRSHRSSARRDTITPSDLQTSRFYSPIARLRRASRRSFNADVADVDEKEGMFEGRPAIVRHVEGRILPLPKEPCLIPSKDLDKRRKFILRLAKALLSFGAPSHRIESQLTAAAILLDCKAAFVHIPSIIIVSFGDGEEASYQTTFVRAGGRIALTSLARVHDIYRDVLHDEIGAEAGTEALKKLLRAPPIYPLLVRCGLAFVCASIICVIGFGGAVVDMFISGACASFLQYLGLSAASKSSMYANVYECVSSATHWSASDD
jgi:uncharacterized membrane protein YjjP (DUF1212 family)